MRRGKPSAIIELLAIIAIVLGVRAVGSHAGPLATIEGTVVSAGGSPIAGATVTARGMHLLRTARTDGSGHFAIGGLTAGTYRVTATAAGYVAGARSLRVAAGATAAVRLALAPARKHLAPIHVSADKADTAAAKEAEPVAAGAPMATPMPAPPPRRYAVRTRHAALANMPAALAPAATAPALEQDRAMNTEGYARIDDSPFLRTQLRPLSTFSVDVDTASYANMRRFLHEGQLPPKDAVRIEELVNYFHYDYPAPARGEPFSITTEVGPAPWNPKHRLVRIGLATPPIEQAQVPARNLVFLIDVSGSMMSPNKLPLLKSGLALLVEQLRPQDRVAMVVYAGNSGLVLPPTSGRDKASIRASLARLEAGGSTNGAAGIQLAYDVAARTFIRGGINRVILCTDGDFNVGVTSQGDLTRLIERERDRGVFLTVLGFGMGNLKDSTMEQLADRGNGNYAYIDSLAEARKVLVKEAGATLVTVAKDVKLQIELNPVTVAGYRLIGYEDRRLRDQDFNDDKKDAGDIGAGRSVTALYELVPAGQEVPGAKVDALKYQTPHLPASASGDLMTVKIRYKAPGGKTSKLLTRAVTGEPPSLARTSNDFRWAAAVAGFGMMLRGSKYRGNESYAQLEALARGAVGADREGYRKEFLNLLATARKLAGAHGPKIARP